MISPRAAIKKITENIMEHAITGKKCYTGKYSLNAKESNEGELS